MKAAMNLGEKRKDKQTQAARLQALLPALAGKTILVIGDVILDEYITGIPTRMSREAPVPVLELESKRYFAGGSANPAANIVSLGSRARQIGVIGEDAPGTQLLRILQEHGIDAIGIIRCGDRPTTVKTRILAQMGLRFPQQVTRIDTLTRRAIDRETEGRILAGVKAAIADAHAVLLSQYNGGLLTRSLVAGVQRICARHQVLLTADVQGSFDSFRALDVIKCNADDARRSLNRALNSDADFSRAAQELHKSYAVRRATIITRGSQGATLALAGGALHCPAPKVSDVFDTVGAGDTSIAALTLALAAGGAPQDALLLANYASGIVVRHLGNYAPSRAELSRSMHDALAL